MDALKLISGESLKEQPPVFEIGDTVRVDTAVAVVEAE